MRKGPPLQTMEERFWRYVTPSDPDECWAWLGSTNAKGYGKACAGGGGNGWVLAHRAAWIIHNGPIPEGLCVLHTCDNPPCVNPAHLWLGTPADNSADMVQKGRQGKRGFPTRIRSTLADDEVRDIRNASAGGASRALLARCYFVTEACIYGIARGHTRLRAGGPIER